MMSTSMGGMGASGGPLYQPRLLPMIRELSTESVGGDNGNGSPLPEQSRRAQLAIGEIQRTMARSFFVSGGGSGGSGGGNGSSGVKDGENVETFDGVSGVLLLLLLLLFFFIFFYFTIFFSDFFFPLNFSP